MTLDLDRYLRRIGFAGRPAPDHATLARVQVLHVAAIPFENLAALAGEPIALDVRGLESKLLSAGRGGWCFEQNLLLAHALEAIGFSIRRLAARVRWNVPAHVVTARSHMLLRVALPEGDYIADAGFGGLTLTAPLRLEPDIEQPTPHEPHRLRAGSAPGLFILEAKVRGRAAPSGGQESEWRELYHFDLTEQLQADYEVSNWFLLTNPASQFLSNLMVARAEPAARHALRNGRYSIHRADGTIERRFLDDVGELKRVLAEAFLVRAPESPALDARLSECVRREVLVP